MQSLVNTLQKSTNNKQYCLVDLTPYMDLTVHSSKVLSKKAAWLFLTATPFLLLCIANVNVLRSFLIVLGQLFLKDIFS